jgi:micrococcal nuclease
MTKRRLTKYLTSLAVFIILAYIWPLIQAKMESHHVLPAGQYAVTQVFDGDTIQVNMGGTLERIRMIGVDTPETHKPGAPVQCFGPQASDYTKKLLTNQAVRLEADPTGDNRDRYDRLLRYVYFNEALVNKQLIEQGYGFAYISFPFTKKVEFMQAQFAASGQKRGLWAACQPKSDGGRWQSNNL